MKKILVVFSLALLCFTGCFNQNKIEKEPISGLKKMEFHLNSENFKILKNEGNTSISRYPMSNSYSHLEACSMIDGITGEYYNEKHYIWENGSKSYYPDHINSNGIVAFQIVDDSDFSLTSLTFRDINLFPEYVQYLGGYYNPNIKKVVKQYIVTEYNLWYIANQQLGEDRPLIYTTNNNHSDIIGLYW